MTTENNGSIKRRIAECWGFYFKCIVLMETGYTDGWCTHASFQVNGVGYSTDFKTLVMEPAFDADEGWER